MLPLLTHLFCHWPIPLSDFIERVLVLGPPKCSYENLKMATAAFTCVDSKQKNSPGIIKLYCYNFENFTF